MAVTKPQPGTQRPTATAPGPVLAAVDATPNSDIAAHAAAYLSRRLGLPLDLVHCWAPMVTAFGPAGVPPMDIEAAYREPAAALLDDQVARLAREGTSVSGRHLVLGAPGDEIAALASELQASLVVIGSRGLGTVGRVVRGSVSESVVHHATSPVLVLHPHPHAWPPSAILVGDDGSEPARAAAHVAARVAAATGIPITIATVIPDGWLNAGSPAEARALAAAREAGDSMTAELAEQLHDTHGVVAKTAVLSGVPGEALVEAARGPRPALVAVGCRGLGAVGRVALGSVSAHLLHSAPGPVLVCPRASG